MCENKHLIYVIIIILILIIIYMGYNHSNKENFAVSDDIKLAINEIYQADIDAMRNLANISKSIMNSNDLLNIPANEVNMLGATTNVKGNLVVDGSVTFKAKNNNIMEIFPKFMVIAWANNSIPKGWALCDGKTYKLDSNGNAIASNEGSVIITPDLRGRFVLGSGQGDNLTNRSFDDKGGSETHVLTIDEMPNHRHFTHFLGQTGQTLYKEIWKEWIHAADPNHTSVINNSSPANGAAIVGSDSPNYVMQNAQNSTANVGVTNSVGNNAAHNNMPPFYVLTYIMKL